MPQALYDHPCHGLTVLDEPNVLGVLAEALAADVHAVLADQTTLVRADTAAEKKKQKLKLKIKPRRMTSI